MNEPRPRVLYHVYGDTVDQSGRRERSWQTFARAPQIRTSEEGEGLQEALRLTFGVAKDKIFVIRALTPLYEEPDKQDWKTDVVKLPQEGKLQALAAELQRVAVDARSGLLLGFSVEWDGGDHLKLSRRPNLFLDALKTENNP